MNDKQHWIDEGKAPEDVSGLANKESLQTQESSMAADDNDVVGQTQVVPESMRKGLAAEPVKAPVESALVLSERFEKNAAEDCARRVGARLVRLREDRNWVLDDISAQLKVPVAKLRALEAGQLNKLPGLAFAVGLLRSYAKVLGIDATPFVEELHGIEGLFKTELYGPGMRADLPRNHESVIWHGRWKKRWLWMTGIVLALVGAALYLNHLSSFRSANLSASNLEVAVPLPMPQVKPAQAAVAGVPSTVALPSASNSVESATATLAVPRPVPVRQNQLTPNQAHQASPHANVSQDNRMSMRQQDGKKNDGGTLPKGAEHTVQDISFFNAAAGSQAGLEFIELEGQRKASSKDANPRQNNLVQFDLL